MCDDEYQLWVYGTLVVITLFYFTVCDDEYQLWVYGTLAVTTLHYWVCAAGYMFLDLTGRPHFLSKYA